jgi:hypothetical protein
MQISGRQPTEVRDILETQDREGLSRAAHKIAWARMNGSIDAANPFVADPNRLAPQDRGHDERPSRHRWHRSADSVTASEPTVRS